MPNIGEFLKIRLRIGSPTWIFGTHIDNRRLLWLCERYETNGDYIMLYRIRAGCLKVNY